MRAITHIHTRHSWDGNIPPEKLVESLLNQGIALAVVTDHNTFEGSRECRRIVERRGLDLRIPVAAEVRTDRGDVIVVFEEEPHGVPPMDALTDWNFLERSVRDAGGLLWLPHPYDRHDFVEEMAPSVDVIEVFNARCSEEQDRNASHLCNRHGRVAAYGADIHRHSEVGRCVVDYADKGSVLETLRHAPTPVRTDRSMRSEMFAAEFEAARTRRRPVMAAYLALHWARHRALESRSTVR